MNHQEGPSLHRMRFSSHTDFSLRVDTYTNIFQICHDVKRGFLNSKCNFAPSFTKVHLQTSAHRHFAVACSVGIIMSAIVMQNTKEWQEVIPQTVSTNDTKAKHISALHLQSMCLMHICISHLQNGRCFLQLRDINAYLNHHISPINLFYRVCVIWYLFFIWMSL